MHEALPGVQHRLNCVYRTPLVLNLAKYDVALNHRRHVESRSCRRANKKHTTNVVCFLFGIRQ